MAFSSYTFQSTETLTRTFWSYGVQGDTKPDRYKGAIPTDLAEKVWTYQNQAAVNGNGFVGGGISIIGARREVTPEIEWEDV